MTFPAELARVGGPNLASLPMARQLAGEVLSLPIGPHLPLNNVENVIEVVRAAAA